MDTGKVDWPQGFDKAGTKHWPANDTSERGGGRAGWPAWLLLSLVYAFVLWAAGVGSTPQEAGATPSGASYRHMAENYVSLRARVNCLGALDHRTPLIKALHVCEVGPR